MGTLPGRYFSDVDAGGWLASKLGYKGGIIIGPAHGCGGGTLVHPCNAHCQVLGVPTGVCFIASGLTFLETIANPYTTVFGPQRYAATRINLAQSCNGIGWILGPITRQHFLLFQRRRRSKHGEPDLVDTLLRPSPPWLTSWRSSSISPRFPTSRAEDDYHLDDATPGVVRSIWTHPHFVFAVLAQFLYVAAQAGIFSFFIIYMTSEAPDMPASWRTPSTKDWIEVKTNLAKQDIKDPSGLVEKLKRKADPVSAFLGEELSEDTSKALADHQSGADVRELMPLLAQDLNNVVKQDPNKIVKEGPNKGKKNEVLADPRRFDGVVLGNDTSKLLSQWTAEQKDEEAREKARTAAHMPTRMIPRPRPSV